MQRSVRITSHPTETENLARLQRAEPAQNPGLLNRLTSHREVMWPVRR
jgi:hypothetical protein